MSTRTNASRPARVAGPDPMDFYQVRSLLDDEERQTQDAVARFVDERVIPVIGDAFDAHRFPAELIPEIAGLGLLGCNLEGYDCAGLNNVIYGLVCQELERGDSGLRSFVSVQGSLCMWPIHTYGSEEQKQRWLPQLAAGEALASVALGEPGGVWQPEQMGRGCHSHFLQYPQRWIRSSPRSHPSQNGCVSASGTGTGKAVAKSRPGSLTRAPLRTRSPRSAPRCRW